MGAARSGAYLLFVFLGGATFFFGPIIGAVLMVMALVLLSELTQGLVAVPGPGVPVHGDVRAGRHRQPDHDEPARWRPSASCGSCGPAYLALAGTAFAILAGAGAMIEMVYHLQLNAALGPAA